ncbi:PA24B phospholipase, partial [Orthonyx spaldingii]|nr:PA24B phospholipase [Orthonyx spaldingii]
NLDLRLGFDLCSEEKDFICKRKKVVAAALKNVLHLDEDLEEDEVPVVAVVTAAGGVRSMTAMFGSLLALQDLGVLDCVSYITGLSATTCYQCCFITLLILKYKQARMILNVFVQQKSQSLYSLNSASALKCFSKFTLRYCSKSMHHVHVFTMTSALCKQESTHKLSDQQLAVNEGQNPLPIYLSLNVKDDFSTLDFKEWVEFTPYEVGLLKYGAFVRSEDFGSEFFMGHRMKKIPESHICFLEGTWSNIFSQSFMDAVYLSGHSEHCWHRWTRD